MMKSNEICGFGQESHIGVRVNKHQMQMQTVRDVCFNEIEQFEVLGVDDQLHETFISATAVDIVGVEDDEVMLYDYSFANGRKIRCTNNLEVLSIDGKWIPLREMDYETQVIAENAPTTVIQVQPQDSDFVFEVMAQEQPIFVNGICVKSGVK